MRDIEELRAEIDIIDKELVTLFEKRLDIISEIAESKFANNIPIIDLAREKELLTKIINIVKDKSHEDAIIEVFKFLIDISKGYQKDYIAKKLTK